MEDHGGEHDLITRTARGDEQAFTTPYRRYQQTIYRFAYLMTGSAGTAEDITQDVFLMLMRDAAHFDPQRGTLIAFLRGVARNHVSRHLERSRRYAELEDEAIQPAAERSVDHARIREAVLALPPHYREAVVLCDFEGLKYDEAAGVLNVAPGTVASRLNRGHQMLAERFGVRK